MNHPIVRRFVGTTLALALALLGLLVASPKATASVPQSYRYLAADGGSVLMKNDTTGKYLLSVGGTPWRDFSAGGLIQLVAYESAYAISSGKVVITPFDGSPARTVTLMDGYVATSLQGVWSNKLVTAARAPGESRATLHLVDLDTGVATPMSGSGDLIGVEESGLVWRQEVPPGAPWPDYRITVQKWTGETTTSVYPSWPLDDFQIVDDQIWLLENDEANGTLKMLRMELGSAAYSQIPIPAFNGQYPNFLGGTPERPMVQLNDRAYVLVNGSWVRISLPSRTATVELTYTDRPLVSNGNDLYWVGDNGSLAPVVPTDFKDVEAGSKFYTEISWMASERISTGWSDGTYRPTAPIGREAMAAFLYRLAGEPAFTPPPTATFSDVAVGSKFYKEIEWLVSTGITTGWPDGTYRPTAPIGRDAMAAFLYRLNGSPAFTPPDTATFTDVPVGGKFYTEIEWMVSTGITTGYSDGTYRSTAPVARDAMAAFLYRYVNSFGRPTP